MLGGELLATGSSSCVFNPNFPCRKNGNVDDERISKIIFNPGAKEESQYEKKMNEAIQKIKQLYQKEFLLFAKKEMISVLLGL